MERAVLKSSILPAELQPAPPKPRGELNPRLLAANSPPLGELPPPPAPPLVPPPVPPQPLLLTKTQDDTNRSLAELFAAAYGADPFPAKVLHMLADGVHHCRRISLGECSRDADDVRLRYRGRLYVPEYEPLRLRLLQTHHEVAATGHPCRSKTLELLKRTYFWPSLQADVDRFVRNCHTCQRSRTPRHAPFGILRPLPIPDRPWEDIAMDFVTGLPASQGYDAIWVVVDRLTKARHLVPCCSSIDAAGLVDLFIQHIFRLHGLPTRSPRPRPSSYLGEEDMAGRGETERSGSGTPFSPSPSSPPGGSECGWTQPSPLERVEGSP